MCVVCVDWCDAVGLVARVQWFNNLMGFTSQEMAYNIFKMSQQIFYQAAKRHTLANLSSEFQKMYSMYTVLNGFLKNGLLFL
jgi:hypothetical protein